MAQPSRLSAASLRLFVAVLTVLFLRPVYTLSVSSTVLVVAKDNTAANSATSGLKGYGIPYQTFLTSTSSSLPALNSTADSGKFGAIVILDEVASAAQLTAIRNYQKQFSVRLVRLNAQPGADSGTDYASSGAGCCDNGVEQLVSLTNTTGFPTAGLKKGATVSSTNLWHTPAVIKNSTTTWQVAQFAAAASFKSATVAAVINDVDGRQQMVWFMPFDTAWSPTSNFLMHSWIQWATRGLYTGYRRINLNTQIDDVFLITELFKPSTGSFRVRTDDLDAHVSWTPDINAKMPAGSDYFIELGHNGNGNIEGPTPDKEDSSHDRICKPGSVEYPDQPDETAATIEFQKPLGTGTDLWPKSLTSYTYDIQCAESDELENWFTNEDNLNAFSHLSHTFTHEDLNNATYADASREIFFNQAWLDQVGISQAQRFSPKGLIPPAITGLHNGDAIRAWMDNGITGVVGDNTRTKLLNADNEYWPLFTNVKENGYAGLPIIPRWSTNMYYNCDKIACNLALFQNVSMPKGTWDQLLDDTKITNVRNLLALRRDPYMFHQANLRQTDIEYSKVNGVNKRWSLLMIWVETVVQELVRLTDWPIITLKHDDMVQAFLDRYNRDQCGPALTYNYGTSGTRRTITGVTVSAAKSCSAKIPVTLPGPVKSAGGATSEQVGSDPLTLWVTYSGKAQTLDLSTPIVL